MPTSYDRRSDNHDDQFRRPDRQDYITVPVWHVLKCPGKISRTGRVVSVWRVPDGRPRVGISSGLHCVSLAEGHRQVNVRKSALGTHSAPK